MSDLLRATCKSCGISFVSAHQGQRGALGADPGLALRETCTHCGCVGTYRARDYYHGALVGPCEPVVPATPS